MLRTIETVISKVGAILYVIAIPTLLLATGVAWAINDTRLYEYGFEKYEISRVTGIQSDNLAEVARDLRSYFNSTQEPLEIRTTVFGLERDILNKREIAHMRDVKHLIWGVYIVGTIAGIFLLIMTLYGYLLAGTSIAAPILSRWTFWGSTGTIGLILAFGLIAAVAFDQVFLLFHKLSFANDFWQLDPRRDYLIMLFPQGFWFDATLFVAAVSMGGALLLSLVSGAYILRMRKLNLSLA